MRVQGIAPFIEAEIHSRTVSNKKKQTEIFQLCLIVIVQWISVQGKISRSDHVTFCY